MNETTSTGNSGWRCLMMRNLIGWQVGFFFFFPPSCYIHLGVRSWAIAISKWFPMHGTLWSLMESAFGPHPSIKVYIFTPLKIFAASTGFNWIIVGDGPFLSSCFLCMCGHHVHHLQPPPPTLGQRHQIRNLS